MSERDAQFAEICLREVRECPQIDITGGKDITILPKAKSTQPRIDILPHEPAHCFRCFLMALAPVTIERMCASPKGASPLRSVFHFVIGMCLAETIKSPSEWVTARAGERFRFRTRKATRGLSGAVGRRIRFGSQHSIILGRAIKFASKGTPPRGSEYNRTQYSLLWSGPLNDEIGLSVRSVDHSSWRWRCLLRANSGGRRPRES